MGAGGGGTRRGRWAPRRGPRVLGGARGRRRAIANDTARRAKKTVLVLVHVHSTRTMTVRLTAAVVTLFRYLGKANFI